MWNLSVFVLFLIGTGIRLVNSLEESEQDTLDEPEPFFPQESGADVSGGSQKCPRDVLIGGISEIADVGEAARSSGSKAVDIEGCSSPSDFVNVGAGLYAPNLVTNFLTARSCCSAHGLALVDLSKVQKSFAGFTDFKSLEEGIWVKGSSGKGKSTCGVVGFVTVPEAELGSLCDKTFRVICDGGDESDISRLHGKCESRERFERVSKSVLALKMACMTYGQAQKCCHAAHLNLVDLDAEEPSKEKEEINTFLQSKNVTYWHKRKDEDEGGCNVLCPGPAVGNRSCEKRSSVMCTGIWKCPEKIEKQKCDSMAFKSVLHGKALISSTPAQRETAEMCCKLQPGYESLLSLDHEGQARKFANSHRVQLRQPYHVYTRADSAGNYLYAQGKSIPREAMSGDKYPQLLTGHGGDCLFGVVEPEVGQRVTRYVTGKCSAYQPFVCMRFDPEELYNITCKSCEYFNSLECRRQPPTEAQRFELSNQNRYLAKLSLEVDIGGWKGPRNRNPTRAYELVETTFHVFRKIVPVNVLPLGFTTKVMILFVEMNGRYGPEDKVDFISEGDLGRIKTILKKCMEKLPVIPYVFNDCNTLILGTTDEKDNSTRKYYCPTSKFSYNHFTTDPILHSTQNVFMTVRNLCFPTFRENSVRMFHRWQLAINDVFATKLADRWSVQIETRDYWDKLLGAHFDEKVRVTDSVAMAVLDKSKPWSMAYPRGQPPNARMPGF